MANFPETRISLILRLGEGGDVQAWQEFADIYVPAIHGLALRKGLQPADAEDVTQEVLFGVARAIERFEPDRSRAKFRTWLSRIARNMIADFCVNRAKRPVQQAATDSWLQAACSDASHDLSEHDQDFDAEYRKAIFHVAAKKIRSRVTPTTWSSFEQTQVLGRNTETVAQELGISMGALYVARCRVLKMLRAEVEELQGGYSGEFTPTKPSEPDAVVSDQERLDD